MLDSRCHVQRDCRRFENRLRNVMLIPPIQALDMQIESAFLNKRLQEFFNQFGLKIADAGCFEVRLVYQIWPA